MLRSLRLPLFTFSSSSSSSSSSLIHLPVSLRPFTLSASLAAKPLPPRLKIDDADLTISYLKGSGPGGQKINKTNSAVQLIHRPTGLVVKSQATRSRSQNEKIARQLLADRIEELQKGDQSRLAIKADRARKKKASKLKKSRRKYRDLEQKQADDDVEPAEDDEHTSEEKHPPSPGT
ncbi:RF-1 domain-containing protein [Aspergillus ambiguus]|uniref:peptide chain release factor family protein n=1 Tax=Aspergillus ambiguus TaxID=176160 RepID=UPI003CCDAFDB